MKRIFKYLGIALGILIVLPFVAWKALDVFYQPQLTILAFPETKTPSAAANFYKEAIAAMPDKDGLTAEEKEQFKPKHPLDIPAATRLLEKYQKSIALLKQGAAEPECEWGIDWNPEAKANQCPQAKGLDLLRLVCSLQARLHLAQNAPSLAADDLLLILRVGPHWEQPEMIINLLIRYTTDMTATYFILEHLAEFDASSLQKLSDGLAEIHQPHAAKEVIANDAKQVTTLYTQAIAHGLHKSTQQQHSVQVSPNGTIPSQTISFHRGLPLKYLVYSAKVAEKKILELEKLMGQPYSQSRESIQKFNDDLRKYWWLKGPFATFTAGNGLSARNKEVQVQTAREVLQTAVTAQLHNPATVRGELAKIRDPYNDMPLEWHDCPGGIEVKLKHDPGKRSFTLKVELEAKRAE